MPPGKSVTLTEAELRLMDVFWERGACTVQQVVDAVEGQKLLAYNSVLTTVRILERKGYLRHMKDGRAHVYTPIVAREEATRTEVRHLVRRLFNNSHELLVLNVLSDEGIDAEELERLRKLLNEKAEDGGRG